MVYRRGAGCTWYFAPGTWQSNRVVPNAVLCRSELSEEPAQEVVARRKGGLGGSFLRRRRRRQDDTQGAAPVYALSRQAGSVEIGKDYISSQGEQVWSNW